MSNSALFTSPLSDHFLLVYTCSSATASLGLVATPQMHNPADVSGGNRPGFTGAAPPALGEALYDAFVAAAREAHPVVQTGRFGADMQVHLVNDGPVTIPMRIEPPRSTAARVAAPRGG